MLLNADKSLPRFVVSSLVLGSLNWLTWTMTTLQATWRKYVEGTTIKALSEQPGAKLYYRNSRTLKILLREIYPPIIAVLHARLFDQAAQQVLSGLPPLGVKVISTLLAMLVYQATALSTRNFDIRQMKDCAEAAESTFVLDGLLASSSFTALRWLGKGINGQLLTDILHKVSLSLTASGRIVMGLNALGVSAVIHQAFATFASGSDTSVLSFYLAEAQAAKVAKQLIPLSIGLSILLPALQCRARFATVLDQIKLDSEVPRRSVSAIGVTELS